MTEQEQELQDYTWWLMNVWNPEQLHIPFAIDAPKAYLRYKTESQNHCETHQCKVCGAIFDNPQNLYNHYNETHN